jgi:hypothetical protein
MCEPTSITMAALAVGSFAVSAYSAYNQYTTSNQQADNSSYLAYQNAALERQQQIEIYNAEVAAQQQEYDRQSQDAALQYQRTLNQQSLELAAQDSQYQLLSKKTNEAASTAAVRAGEGGVGGLSVDALMSDYYRQELDSRLALDTDRNSIAMKGSNNYYDYTTGQTRLNENMKTNSKNLYSNLEYGLKSGNFSLLNNINRINDSRVSPTTTGLNIASSALSSGAMYYSARNPSVAPSRIKPTNLSARPLV